MLGCSPNCSAWRWNLPAFHAIVGGKLSAAHMTWQLRQSTAVNQPTVVVPEDRKNLLLVTFFNADPDETPSDRMTDDRIHKSVFKYSAEGLSSRWPYM